MALQTDLTSDEELSTTIDLSDAQAIRKQLDGLENMYTEVLKLLGTQNSLITSGCPKKRLLGRKSGGFLGKPGRLFNKQICEYRNLKRY